MLNSITCYLQNLADETFEEYFESYVLSMQKSTVDTEIEYLLRNNFLTIEMLSSLVDSSYQEIHLW